MTAIDTGAGLRFIKKRREHEIYKDEFVLNGDDDFAIEKTTSKIIPKAPPRIASVARFGDDLFSVEVVNTCMLHSAKRAYALASKALATCILPLSPGPVWVQSSEINTKPCYAYDLRAGAAWEEQIRAIAEGLQCLDIENPIIADTKSTLAPVAFGRYLLDSVEPAHDEDFDIDSDDEESLF